MVLLKLAFRNISRNKRRSWITILSVGVGLGALIFLWGFGDGTNYQMRENVIRLSTGHIQIHAKGFEKSLTSELLLPDKDALLAQLQARSEIVAQTERVRFEALIGTSEHSRGVLLIGMDPVKEPTVTHLEKFITRGSYLMPQDPRSVLIGDRLAEKLQVGLDDKVVVMTQAIDGTMSGFAFRVRGIFHAGSQPLDEMTAFISLPASQELLGIEGRVHDVVLRLKNSKRVAAVAEDLKRKMDLNAIEVLAWYEIVPEVEQWVRWAEAVIRTILIAVMVVIGVGIMNTVLMSVFERKKELGVMMALGTSPSQIFMLIVLETLILEFFGILLGLIGGYLVTYYFSIVGIGFQELEQAFSRSYMSTVTYTRVEFNHVVQSVITLVLMSSFIGLYPAWKAGRTEPVKAIYHS